MVSLSAPHHAGLASEGRSHMAIQKSTSERYPRSSAVNNPRASKSGQVHRHILVAEKALGRYLPKGAEVHHVDENKRNYANSNLVICQDQAYHRLLHARLRILRAGGNPNTDSVCSVCRLAKPRDCFYKRTYNKSHGCTHRCKGCESEYSRARRRAFLAHGGK